jgi:hypothetical protein
MGDDRWRTNLKTGFNMTQPSDKPPQPTHVEGTKRGEEAGFYKEAGRSANTKHYRSARDSTGIDSARKGPIDPRMPNIPPA